MSDPFELLGLEASFELDPSLLATRHRELSRALHPDRYAGRAASERRQALGKAIEVNEAFRLLKDPVKRAELLLERLGVQVGEQAERRVAPDFLMEIMELRETLGELRRSQDMTGVEQLCERVRQQQALAEQRLRQEFKAILAEMGDASGASSPKAAERGGDLLPLVAELRYYARFFSEAHAILDELG